MSVGSLRNDDAVMRPDRSTERAVITLSKDTTVLLGRKGFLNASLHEIGHGFGLTHPWGQDNSPPVNWAPKRTSTVMNPLGFNSGQLIRQPDDVLNNIPLFPTACEREGALDASTR